MTSQQTSILHVFRQSVAEWRDLPFAGPKPILALSPFQAGQACTASASLS
jgi:hypothetical protein